MSDNVVKLPVTPITFEQRIARCKTDEEARELLRADGGGCSGPPIPWDGSWKKGWAHSPHGRNDKVHFFREIDAEIPKLWKGRRWRFFRSACGFEVKVHDRFPLFEPGNFVRCVSCQRVVAWRERGVRK